MRLVMVSICNNSKNIRAVSFCLNYVAQHFLYPNFFTRLLIFLLHTSISLILGFFCKTIVNSLGHYSLERTQYGVYCLYMLNKSSGPSVHGLRLLPLKDILLWFFDSCNTILDACQNLFFSGVNN